MQMRTLFSVGFLRLSSLGLAQTDQKAWTSTDQQQSPSGSWNPTRTRTTHAETNGRTVDRQSVERLGPDGGYVPYLDTERETVRVNATTTRTIERTFARDPDGGKKLMQVTEDETRAGGSAEQKLVRTTSNPDVNGQLQMTRRATQNTRHSAAGTQEHTTQAPRPHTN